MDQVGSAFDDITFSTNVLAVPEPNTLALILTGGLALAARRWRAKRFMKTFHCAARELSKCLMVRALE